MQFADHIWPFKYVFLWFFNKSIYEIKVYEFYTEYHGFFLHIYPGNILDEWVQELFLQKLRPNFILTTSKYIMLSLEWLICPTFSLRACKKEVTVKYMCC